MNIKEFRSRKEKQHIYGLDLYGLHIKDTQDNAV